MKIKQLRLSPIFSISLFFTFPIITTPVRWANFYGLNWIEGLFVIFCGCLIIRDIINQKHGR